MILVVSEGVKSEGVGDPCGMESEGVGSEGAGGVVSEGAGIRWDGV